MRDFEFVFISLFQPSPELGFAWFILELSPPVAGERIDVEPENPGSPSEGTDR
jgi:hypothetical protein